MFLKGIFSVLCSLLLLATYSFAAPMDNIDDQTLSLLEQMDSAIESLAERVRKQDEEFKSYQENFRPVKGCGYGPWIPSQTSKKCYKIVPKVGNMDDAEKFCKNEEGADGVMPDVLRIKSKTEQDFLVRSVFSQIPASVNTIWLGAKRSEDGMNFKWLDNLDSDVIFANWAQQSQHSKEIEQNKCLMLVLSVQNRLNSGPRHIWEWEDCPCEKLNAIICEKPMRTLADENQIIENLKIELIRTTKEVNELKDSQTITTRNLVKANEELNELRGHHKRMTLDLTQTLDSITKIKEELNELKGYLSSKGKQTEEKFTKVTEELNMLKEYHVKVKEEVRSTTTTTTTPRTGGTGTGGNTGYEHLSRREIIELEEAWRQGRSNYWDEDD